MVTDPKSPIAHESDQARNEGSVVAQIELIDSQAALDAFARRLDDAEIVAIDTEFVRETTYYADLCVIQIATARSVHCIDYMAKIDYRPLHAALIRRDICWVAHSARQDLEVIWHAAGGLPNQLLDTQVAAGLVGYPPQVGLQDLLYGLLGIKLSKSHTRTDWRRRPLGSHQLAYAADDVRHLLRLLQRLTKELERKGRYDWFVEDCQRALKVRLTPDLSTLYRRLKGVGRLRGEAVLAALSLLQWRERRARELNRPRRWVLADATLLRLAQSRPTTRHRLATIEGLSARTISKSGQAILAAISECRNADLSACAGQLPPAERPDPDRLMALQKKVQDCANRLGIHAEVIAAKKDINALVLGKAPPQLVGGWRAELLELTETRA